MSINAIHHVCVQTENYEESLDFYTRILGFEMINETPDFHGKAYNTWLKLNDFLIELQTPKKGEKFNKWSSRNAGPVHMAFMCDNVEEEYKRIRSLGYNDFKEKDGQFLYQVLGKTIFKINAPEGTQIEIRDTLI